MSSNVARNKTCGVFAFFPKNEQKITILFAFMVVKVLSDMVSTDNLHISSNVFPDLRRSRTHILRFFPQ